jgi:CTP:molybdopterin cytidylyltransferase MocA
MFDLLVAEFKDKLVADINGSQLPSTAIAYVLQDMQQQISQLVQQQVQTQREQRDAEQKEVILTNLPPEQDGIATEA